LVKKRIEPCEHDGLADADALFNCERVTTIQEIELRDAVGALQMNSAFEPAGWRVTPHVVRQHGFERGLEMLLRIVPQLENPVIVVFLDLDPNAPL
jgi:hypothetical protein